MYTYKQSFLKTVSAPHHLNSLIYIYILMFALYDPKRRFFTGFLNSEFNSKHLLSLRLQQTDKKVDLDNNARNENDSGSCLFKFVSVL